MKTRILLLLMFFLCGCSEGIVDTKEKRYQDLERSFEKLKNQINRLTEELEHTASQLDSDVTLIKNDISQLSTKTAFIPGPIAMFTPGSKGYEIVNTGHGNFFVALDSLTKYANGYRVTFSIGNPNFATFDRVKINVMWGENNKFSGKSSSIKSNEIKINNKILPGSWNKVSVVLSPATAKETGLIALAFTSDSIVLRPDFRKHS